MNAIEELHSHQRLMIKLYLGMGREIAWRNPGFAQSRASTYLVEHVFLNP
jgi:hypothetical protein